MAISKDIIDQLAKNIKTERDLFGSDGLLKQLSKQLIERALETELTETIGHDKHSFVSSADKNYRNGTSKKTIKTDNGEIELDIPRDRNGEFEPTLVKKHQRRLEGLDSQILALYARGMTTRDIQAYIKELYGTEISPDLISKVTDSILDEVNAWRNRPLDPIYPIVYIDGFVVKCKQERHVVNSTVYVIFGINCNGYKDVLGYYLGETEGAKYWLSVLNELKNRGLSDILMICADGLKGLPESIEAAYPKATFQTCIVHLIRNSLNFVPYKDKRAVAADLKKIYTADTVELAASALDDFELEWGDKYQAIVKSWRNNWENATPFFNYPKDIRKIIYTTNIIESLNRTLRKSVKTRGHFPTADSVFKVLYLATQNAAKKWSMPVRDWRQALNQFSIMYPGRIPEKLMMMSY